MTVCVSLPANAGHDESELSSSYMSNGSQLVSASLASRDAIPCHPLGVKPSGNGLTAAWDLRTAIGTFNILPDEILLMLLEYLDSASLLNIGCTYCSHLFSDTLHRPFYCAHISLDPYVNKIPARNQITRLPNLSPEEFQQSWTDRPFILTEPVKQWPVFKDWSTEALLSKHGDTEFRAEAVDWPFKTYVDYMKNNEDESPLYLFDRNFISKMGLKVGQPDVEPDAAYWPPPCFGEDFFSVLGRDRPDSAWLIVGPERSGSTFHKDPNATSAWNAVIRGSKYWIMFPSSSTLPPPPGVYVSADQSEVTSPLSIAEWLLSFHAEARCTAGCIEGICGEGEILHVPSGWWHLVVNIEPSIAITQNFIPRSHLTAALDFLSNKADQVSGFRKDVDDPYSRFVERMKEAHPELLEQAMQDLEKAKEGKKRKWDEIVHGKADEAEDGEGGGFSFGFGDDGSDVEVP
ncbi:F-box and JmjC domain protein, putative [Paecilomyces variotii No. 5]|uniref:F-box and JmjC domain protein, putative n=1 Tax=Byssochlamys spectabilis (strain No. 5 / NBRC 109023) TaxID=1356009 RepID=V5I5P6_BYSSN|nr:F-box and JmjC domain protein, putative [Paecilomyces variotii No. 5]